MFHFFSMVKVGDDVFFYHLFVKHFIVQQDQKAIFIWGLFIRNSEPLNPTSLHLCQWDKLQLYPKKKEKRKAKSKKPKKKIGLVFSDFQL